MVCQKRELVFIPVTKIITGKLDAYFLINYHQICPGRIQIINFYRLIENRSGCHIQGSQTGPKICFRVPQDLWIIDETQESGSLDIETYIPLGVSFDGGKFIQETSPKRSLKELFTLLLEACVMTLLWRKFSKCRTFIFLPGHSYLVSTASGYRQP